MRAAHDTEEAHAEAAPSPGDAPRRWRDRPRWQRRLLAVGILLTGVATVSVPWWGPRLLSRLDFFHVRTVQFDGVRYTPLPELMRRLSVDTMQSVWQPLEPLERRVAEHPLVRQVEIERDLPGVLRVHVTEREPVALVHTGGRLRPADATGYLLPIDPVTHSLDLPVATAQDTMVLRLLDGLRHSAPALYGRVAEVQVDAPGSARFALTGSAVAAAGLTYAPTLYVRTRSDVTVARFRDILPVEADLARTHRRAVELDLRFRDQVIARLP